MRKLKYDRALAKIRKILHYYKINLEDFVSESEHIYEIVNRVDRTKLTFKELDILDTMREAFFVLKDSFEDLIDSIKAYDKILKTEINKPNKK